MEKKPLLSKQLKLLTNEKWKPYIRYKKETDTWITKAIQEKRTEKDQMERTISETVSKIRILMEK